MSVSPVSCATSSCDRPVSPTASPKGTAASALKEAGETEATTRLKAARGDHVAMRKLAREEAQAKQVEKSAPATRTAGNEPGRIDIMA
jgi:hypothetical protein